MPLEEIRARRSYQAWVANETMEDYSLRYAATSFRKWSPFVITNTALGGISFLALEAIGGAITISYGFANAFPAIVVVCLLIFITNLPIAYYSSKYNIDMDLLTRGAGFGYIGSTVTSLIYACFTFIFFALEAAIMAQALELYFGLPIALGYIISSIVIIPITFLGVTLISKLQIVTQPIWLVLLITPFVAVFYKDPEVLSQWVAFAGGRNPSGEFNYVYFGAATGVLFSLVVQIGEQVDYLRFMPDETKENRLRWWAAVVCAGPGWIVIGGLKILAGSLLAVLALNSGLGPADAVEPIHMYVTAYGFVSEDPWIVLTAATVFVLISQVKINVTNAYAGSLAWSNFYSRVTHYHPGRVVWLVFNILISLLLMLLGVFETLETVLAVYSIVAIAWIGAIFADLSVLKPLGISRPSSSSGGRISTMSTRLAAVPWRSRRWSRSPPSPASSDRCPRPMPRNWRCAPRSPARSRWGSRPAADTTSPGPTSSPGKRTVIPIRAAPSAPTDTSRTTWRIAHSTKARSARCAAASTPIATMSASAPRRFTKHGGPNLGTVICAA